MRYKSALVLLALVMGTTTNVFAIGPQLGGSFEEGGPPENNTSPQASCSEYQKSRIVGVIEYYEGWWGNPRFYVASIEDFASHVVLEHAADFSGGEDQVIECIENENALNLDDLEDLDRLFVRSSGGFERSGCGRGVRRC